MGVELCSLLYSQLRFIERKPHFDWMRFLFL